MQTPCYLNKPIYHSFGMIALTEPPQIEAQTFQLHPKHPRHFVKLMWNSCDTRCFVVAVRPPHLTLIRRRTDPCVPAPFCLGTTRDYDTTISIAGDGTCLAVQIVQQNLLSAYKRMDRLLTRPGERDLHVHQRPSVGVFPQGLARCRLNGRKWPPRITSISVKFI